MNIRRLFRERGLRQYQVAAAAGMTDTRFHRALHGRGPIFREEVERLATFLGLPIAELEPVFARIVE